jgi:hypothetical protein
MICCQYGILEIFIGLKIFNVKVDVAGFIPTNSAPVALVARSIIKMFRNNFMLFILASLEHSLCEPFRGRNGRGCSGNWAGRRKSRPTCKLCGGRIIAIVGRRPKSQL